MNYRDVDPTRVRGEVGVLQEELAERLINISDNSDDPRARAGFLVRGFQLETDFAGTWRPGTLRRRLRNSVRILTKRLLGVQEAGGQSILISGLSTFGPGRRWLRSSVRRNVSLHCSGRLKTRFKTPIQAGGIPRSPASGS
jgi:hypothetical protein